MKYYTAVFVFCFASLFSENIQERKIRAKESVHAALRILKEQPQSAEAWTESKLYLDPSNIRLTKKGVFLQHGRSSIELPNFGYDQKGLFLHCNRQSAKEEAQKHFDNATQSAIEFLGHCAGVAGTIETIPPAAIVEAYQAVEALKEACREYNRGCAIRDGGEVCGFGGIRGGNDRQDASGRDHNPYEKD